MLGDTVSGAGMAWYTVVAMIFAIAVVTGVFLYLFVFGKKSYFTSQGQLPLEDGSRQEHVDQAGLDVPSGREIGDGRAGKR